MQGARVGAMGAMDPMGSMGPMGSMDPLAPKGSTGPMGSKGSMDPLPPMRFQMVQWAQWVRSWAKVGQCVCAWGLRWGGVVAERRGEEEGAPEDPANGDLFAHGRCVLLEPRVLTTANGCLPTEA
jgi:hypothetical protein